MRTSLGLRSVATWLPDRTVSAAEAVDSGLAKAEDVADTGYERLPVADEPPTRMAVRAARKALSDSGVRPDEVGFLAHAWTHHQGHDFWSPAHHVAHELGATGAFPVGVQAMCNGAGVALELAADHVRTAGRRPHALLTTADRFAAPGFDRWRGDYGLWYGDGAAAAVLSAETTPDDDLHLLSVGTSIDPAAEEMHRGDDDFSLMPSPTIDIRRTKRAYLTRYGKDVFAGVVARRVPELLRATLAEAGLEPDDPRIAAVVLPRIGRKALTAAYVPAVAGVTPAPAIDLGARTGHLGAGDLYANLAAAGPLPDSTGDIVVALSAGGGFSWTVAVVRRPPNERSK